MILDHKNNDHWFEYSLPCNPTLAHVGQSRVKMYLSKFYKNAPIPPAPDFVAL